jgi:diacylglycerol kinase family enzyme
VKVSLFYNSGAGDSLPLQYIRDTIEGCGHTLVQVVDKESEAARVLDTPAELVVAAGGDGTVSAAARVLLGLGIPLAILPVGTANNIARSLGDGHQGTIDELIQRWDRARLQPFDLGVVCGSFGERHFVESVGSGLIPAGIAAAQARPLEDEKQSPVKLAHAATKYHGVLARLKPRPWTIRLDSSTITGEFLLVEVLNTGCVGPNLVLSRDATPSDGFFSVIIAAEKDRHDLRVYLEQVIDGHDCSLALPSRQATRVEMHGPDDIHVDDTLLGSTSGVVSMNIQPGAVQLLV